jgi:type IV fimbrial biogenesis protein FimT
MTRQPRRPHGFTLIELMVTLVIAAILMMVAVPSFVSFQKNTELTSAANSLLAAINAARGEAMKRGMSVIVVPTGNGSDWKTGWVVVVDKNTPRTYTATEDNTVLTQAKVPSGISITVNGIASVSEPYILFDASGFSKTKANGPAYFSISFARTDVAAADQYKYKQIRIIKIASTGRVKICTPESATDAKCLATGS